MTIKTFHNGKWVEASQEEKEMVYLQLRLMIAFPLLIIYGLFLLLLAQLRQQHQEQP